MRLPPFQALLDAHGRDVHRFLIAMVGAVDADDCYQETWLAALRAYPRLTDASTSAAGCSRSPTARRSTTSAPARGEPSGGRVAETCPARAAGPDARQPADDVCGRGRVAARQAADRARPALRADAAYAEIATVMETSEEAARRNVHEGLKRLRKEYRP